MSRMSALKENGLEQGSEKYKYWNNKLSKLLEVLWKMENKSVTDNRIDTTLCLLREFERGDIEFTLGSINYKWLAKFLKYSNGFIEKDYIKECLKEWKVCDEVNPMSYGYNDKDDENLVRCIIDILEMKGAPKVKGK